MQQRLGLCKTIKGTGGRPGGRHKETWKGSKTTGRHRRGAEQRGRHRARGSAAWQRGRHRETRQGNRCDGRAHGDEHKEDYLSCHTLSLSAAAAAYWRRGQATAGQTEAVRAGATVALAWPAAPTVPKGVLAAAVNKKGLSSAPGWLPSSSDRPASPPFACSPPTSIAASSGVSVSAASPPSWIAAARTPSLSKGTSEAAAAHTALTSTPHVVATTAARAVLETNCKVAGWGHR